MGIRVEQDSFVEDEGGQMNWTVTVERYLAEGRTVSGGKGDGTAQQQLDEQNKLQQQAFTAMQAQQKQVNDAVSPYLSGNIGFDPSQLASLRSQFLNQESQNYNQAGKNVRTALMQRGSLNSTQPVGGDYTRGIASLQGGLASDTAAGLTNINLQNLQQALTNKFNAASLVNGQSAQLTSPIASFGSGASNALDQYVFAANQGFGNSFTKAFGGALGNTLGSFGVSSSTSHTPTG